MKACIVIPVRYESTRFPGKPLAKINGKTMIQMVWENAKKSYYSDAVFVLTDSEKIYRTVEDFGGRVIMTPSDVKSGTERIASVFESFDEYDFIFNLQGDEPLFKGKYIDLLIERFPEEDNNFVCGTYYFPLSPSSALDPNKVKVVFNKNNSAMYFSRSPIPTKGPYYKHIGVYLYKRDFIKKYLKLLPLKCELSEKLEQLRILEYGYGIFVTQILEDTIGVDTEEDLKKVERFLKNGI